MSRVCEGRVLVRPTVKRTASVLQQLEAWQEAGEIPPAAAEQLAGKIGFRLQAVHKNVGRATLQPLFVASCSQERVVKWGPELRGMHAFLRVLLQPEVLPPRVFSLRAGGPRRHVLIYTDASDAKGQV